VRREGQQTWCEARADGDSPDARGDDGISPPPACCRREADGSRHDSPGRPLPRPDSGYRNFYLSERAMNQTFSGIETEFSSVIRAIEALRQGRGILVSDDADRENEADLIFAAATLTVPQMAMLIRECSGIVCLCLTEEKAKSLELPPMVAVNTCRNRTAFTVTIEAAEGVTTGVSAADRTTTVKTAAAEQAKPSDLARPGHVFPLIARPGGVLARRGHTEATVDLARLAGHGPCGVLCELTNPDGTMAKGAQIEAFAAANGFPLVTVEALAAYRRAIGDC
jgi:3,4-dihydroxy 2-butanone 4-phosphate synthase